MVGELHEFSKTEMFKGGGVGQPGNVLRALGEGFMFRKAVLKSVEYDAEEGEYVTTYVGGELQLTPQGPWLHRGHLRARDITAVNRSVFDHTTGELTFVLEFYGQFANRPSLYFHVMASYQGAPEFKYDDEGNPVFQRGTEFDATITISNEDLSP